MDRTFSNLRITKALPNLFAHFFITKFTTVSVESEKGIHQCVFALGGGHFLLNEGVEKLQ